MLLLLLACSLLVLTASTTVPPAFATPSLFVIEQRFSDSSCSPANVIATRVVPFVPNQCTYSAQGYNFLYTCSNMTRFPSYNTKCNLTMPVEDPYNPIVTTPYTCQPYTFRGVTEYYTKMSCATFQSNLMLASFQVASDCSQTCSPRSLDYAGSTYVYMMDGTTCQSLESGGLSYYASTEDPTYAYFNLTTFTSKDCSGQAIGFASVPTTTACSVSREPPCSGSYSVHPWPVAALPTASPTTASPTAAALRPPVAVWIQFQTFSNAHNHLELFKYYDDALPHAVAKPPERPTHVRFNYVYYYTIILDQPTYACDTVFPPSAPVTYFNVTAGDDKEIGVLAQGVTETFVTPSGVNATRNALITFTMTVPGRGSYVFTADGKNNVITVPNVVNPPWTNTTYPVGPDNKGTAWAFQWGRSSWDTICSAYLMVGLTTDGGANVYLDCMFKGKSSYKIFGGETCGGKYGRFVGTTATSSSNVGRRQLGSGVPAFVPPAACTAMNLTGDFLAACSYDVGLTGDASYAYPASYAQVAYLAAEARRNASEALLSLGVFSDSTSGAGNPARLAAGVVCWVVAGAVALMEGVM